ncbi:MAG: zf-HC2 domain-containing protein [candidate division KSB1 bacterium]|nr:zf-HC2 domain-containing protein [candidate division KSB1 bacterium]
MYCSEIRDHLQDYIDNDLPYSIKQMIDEHLLECLDCHEEVERYRKLNALLQLRSVPDPGPKYWRATWKKIQQQMPARVLLLSASIRPEPAASRNRFWHHMMKAFRPAAAIAAAAVLLLLAVLVGSYHFYLSQRAGFVAERTVEYELYMDDQNAQAELTSSAVPSDWQPDITFAAISKAAIGGIDPVSKGVGLSQVEAVGR